MKLVCDDGVTREFKVRVDPVTKHRHQIQCQHCSATFGFGQISKAKLVLRNHKCPPCYHERWNSAGYLAGVPLLRCVDCHMFFEPRNETERAAVQLNDGNLNTRDRSDEIMAGDLESGMVFD